MAQAKLANMVETVNVLPRRYPDLFRSRNPGLCVLSFNYCLMPAEQLLFALTTGGFRL